MENSAQTRKHFGFFLSKEEDSLKELERNLRIGARKTFGSKSLETSWTFAQAAQNK